jgi:WD40 repeat protein/predicted nucleic acid-binding protein
VFEYADIPCPYPGLRPFEPHEGEIFFGREAHTDRLLEILQRERLLAVIGPSGCGKSSLVRAGLLSALAGGRLGTGSHWRLALMRPGGQPVLALAQALLAPHALGSELGQGPASETARPGLATTTPEDATPDAALLAADLRLGPTGWQRVLAQAQARRLAQAGTSALPTLNLLILAEQFEELFTYQTVGADPREASTFVDLLLAARGEAVAPGGIRVVVTLTMRTDFLGHCVQFAELPEAINHAQYLTPRLKREEMRAAITGPAQLFGGAVDAAFAEQIIDAVGADSDQLPLLQHALGRWWREAERRHAESPQITPALTATVGDVGSALNTHAEEVFAALGAVEQQACEALLRAITAGREGADAVRRPQRLDDIARWSDLPASALRAVAERLAAPEVSFVHVGREQGDACVIDLTHEALMRQWKRLQDWVASELARDQGWRRWQARAAEHQAGEAGLLTGADLARALEWWNPGADVAAWQPTDAWASRYSRHGLSPSSGLETLRAFLLDSQQHAQDELEREARHQRELAEQAQRAERHLKEVLFESHLTHASLAAKGEDYAEAKRILKASAALDDMISAERLHARNLLAGHVATMGGPEADQVYLAEGRPLPALVGGVAVSPDGWLLAAAGERATLVLFDAASGALLRRLEGHDPKASSTGNVGAIAFEPNGRSLYSAGDDGRVIRWAIPSGEKLGEWRASYGEMRGLAIRPDGQQLATGDDSGTLTLWSLPEGRELKQLKGHEDAIADSTRSLVYSPNGQQLASTSYDRTTRLWDVVSGKAAQVLRGHNDAVMGVDFSPDGKLISTSSYDRRIVLWQAATGQPLRVLTGHQNIVFGLRFSADGGTLYSASRDNTMRSWDVASGATLQVFQGHEAGLRSVALASVGADDVHAWAVTAADDGTLRRWPLAHAGVPTAAGHWTWGTVDKEASISAAIAPDSNWTVVGLEDGTLRLHGLPDSSVLGHVRTSPPTARRAGVSATVAPDDRADRMSTRSLAPLSSLYDTDPADLDLAGRPPRVVLDTGVVVSALMFGDAAATRLRRAWRHGFCLPLVCRHTLMDLTQQLGAAQLGFSIAEQQQMLGEYLPYVLKVRLPEATAPGDLEPAGMAFVQLALSGQAHVLVSSDASMLAMSARLPFPVMALEPFLERLRQSAIAPMPLRSLVRRR